MLVDGNINNLLFINIYGNKNNKKKEAKTDQMSRCSPILQALSAGDPYTGGSL